MSATVAVQSKPLALEIHQLLRDLDPSRWRQELEAAVRERAHQLHASLLAALGDAPVGDPAVGNVAAGAPPVSTHLHEIVQLLEHIPSEELPADQLRQRWQLLRESLLQNYDALREALQRDQVHVPTVRPTNYTRSLTHALMATGCVVLAEVLTGSWIWLAPLIAGVLAWSMEAAREFNPAMRRLLLWIFKDIAHPHESHRVNSSTWFVSGLVVLSLAVEPMLCAVAVAVLGFADPAAGLVGRRFGRTKLVRQRSLEGSLAFVVVGALAALAVLSIWHADLTWGHRIAVAGGAALMGAIAELFSGGNLDDNFAVPLGAGFGGWLALLLLAG